MTEPTAPHPLTRPGEVAGVPKLVVTYPTDPDAVAALLPPGLEAWGEPIVQISVYCVPVHGEPERGISVKVPARWHDVDGWYSLGIGIDQESAIFVSRETNGQPKFPCDVRYFRLGDRVEAHATHQGHTFVSFTGTVSGTEAVDGTETTDHEWWVKYSRAVGTTADSSPAYDLDPLVVEVTTSGIATHVEALDGELTLRDSPWDPVATRLPRRGDVEARLLTTRHTGRSVTAAGGLDPVAFWPFADTIGGSRWPGRRGAPPR